MGEKMWAVFSLLMNSEECISAEEIQRQLEEKGYDIGLKAVYAVIKQIYIFNVWKRNNQSSETFWLYY